MPGSGSGLSAKHLLEIAHIIETTVKADFKNRFFCGFQKLNDLGKTVIIDIFDRGFADTFFEKTAEILFIHIDQIGELPNI